jgi:hypothetical protein
MGNNSEGSKAMISTAERIELDHATADLRRPYLVVHSLDDVPEEKVDTEHLGPMQMTKTVRLCLFALRGYLLAMFGLLGFRVLQLAHVI